MPGPCACNPRQLASKRICTVWSSLRLCPGLKQGDKPTSWFYLIDLTKRWLFSPTGTFLPVGFCRHCEHSKSYPNFDDRGVLQFLRGKRVEKRVERGVTQLTGKQQRRIHTKLEWPRNFQKSKESSSYSQHFTKSRQECLWKPQQVFWNTKLFREAGRFEIEVESCLCWSQACEHGESWTWSSNWTCFWHALQL